MLNSLPGEMKRRLGVGAAVTGVVALSVVACGTSTPVQPTSSIQRGSVSNKVSASGAIAAIGSQQIGFPKGAQVKEIDVKVGDAVKAGQVLARLDPFAFQQTLNQQQSQLLNQQAILNRLVNGNTVGEAQRSYDQAQKIVDATQTNVDKQINLDDVTVRQTGDAESLAERQRDQAQRNLAFCRTHSAATPGSGSGATAVAPGGTAVGNGAFGNPGFGGYGQGPVTPVAPFGSTQTNPPSLIIPGASNGNRHRDGQLGGNPQSYYSPGEGGVDPCAGVASSYESSRTAALSAKTQHDQAVKQRQVDKSQGDVSIQNAKQSLITAQNNLELAGTDKPANVAAQQALVDSARASVALSQRDLDNTVLYAPLAGVVGSINGVVNEYVSPETGLTSQAPGTAASIPGVGAAATSSQNQVSVSTNGSKNGGSFITLNDVNSFQVVVPFEESDAAKVTPNLPVEVTFDAIPDLTRDGRVLAISPGGTDISGVTNYYATIVLTDTDPRLKDGQTAEVGVMTSNKDNVLVVPNNAIIKQGGQDFVNVPGPDGKPTQKPFQPGLVGDDSTEVLSGLSEGEQILLPQAQVSPGSGGNKSGGSSGGGGSGSGGGGGGGGGGGH